MYGEEHPWNEGLFECIIVFLLFGGLMLGVYLLLGGGT
jgi:hypothetical protein